MLPFVTLRWLSLKFDLFSVVKSVVLVVKIKNYSTNCSKYLNLLEYTFI